jgi:STE24 endopeptidase
MRRRPRDWWLILSGAAVPLTVVLSNLAPVLLMPLFNRFDPLRDEALASRVRALADRSGVRISDVFEMDMSRQGEKPNAMFTGLGNTKRIVLGDTLLSKFPEDEVEAVVAHELGHQVNGDIWRLIGFGAGGGVRNCLAALPDFSAGSPAHQWANRSQRRG